MEKLLSMEGPFGVLWLDTALEGARLVSLERWFSATCCGWRLGPGEMGTAREGSGKPARIRKRRQAAALHRLGPGGKVAFRNLRIDPDLPPIPVDSFFGGTNRLASVSLDLLVELFGGD